MIRVFGGIALMLGASVPTEAVPVSAVNDGEVPSLRLAIEDLTATFGNRYPRGDEFLARLERVDANGLEELRREALLANPDGCNQAIIWGNNTPSRAGIRSCGPGPLPWRNASTISSPMMSAKGQPVDSQRGADVVACGEEPAGRRSQSAGSPVGR